MIVEEIMKRKVITLKPTNTIFEAMEIMSQKRIRHLPVVDENNSLIGLISDRDIRDASPSIFRKEDESEYQKTIDTIMITNLITGSPLDFIEEVAAIFYDYRIGCLPILSGDELVGIVTETDLLYTFVQLSGAGEPGSHIEICLKDQPGVLSEIASIFRDLRINIISILLYPTSDEEYKKLIVRARVMNTDVLVKKLNEKGYEVLWPKKL